jgi:hypothetical protein
MTNSGAGHFLEIFRSIRPLLVFMQRFTRVAFTRGGNSRRSVLERLLRGWIA